MIDQLVRDNLRLVHLVLKKYYPPNPMYDYEDLYQVGCIGLFRAAKFFDPTKGYKFSTLASRAILNELSREIRNQTAYKRNFSTISLQTPVQALANVEDIPLEEAIESNFDVEDEVIANEMLEEMMQQEPDIVRLTMRGLTQEEIGQKIDSRQVYVSRRLQKLRKSLVG